jgi:hypothetical protein
MLWVIDLTVSLAYEAISAMCDSTGPATSIAIGAGVGVEEGAATGGGIAPPLAGTCCDDDAVSSDSAIVELKSLSSELWDNGDLPRGRACVRAFVCSGPRAIVPYAEHFALCASLVNRAPLLTGARSAGGTCVRSCICLFRPAGDRTVCRTFRSGPGLC